MQPIGRSVRKLGRIKKDRDRTKESGRGKKYIGYKGHKINNGWLYHQTNKQYENTYKRTNFLES